MHLLGLEIDDARELDRLKVGARTGRRRQTGELVDVVRLGPVLRRRLPVLPVELGRRRVGSAVGKMIAAAAGRRGGRVGVLTSIGNGQVGVGIELDALEDRVDGALRPSDRSAQRPTHHWITARGSERLFEVADGVLRQDRLHERDRRPLVILPAIGSRCRPI